MAISLYDEGICDAAELEKKLKRIEDMARAAGRVRAIFGIGSRALTAKEKQLIDTWVSTMKYGDDVITRAYEVTVDSIGKASVSYAGKVLERWHADGLVTLEDVDRAMAEYKRKKAGDGSSFDVDDFFNAALERTYGGEDKNGI
jgi:DnaD/phage-associated family protein